MKNAIVKSSLAAILYILITMNQINSQTAKETNMIYKDLYISAENYDNQQNVLKENTFPQPVSTLYQNYPNPFNEMTLIEFETTGDDFIKLTVTDNSGGNIETLAEGQIEPGNHFVFFKPSPELKEGIYKCRMEIFTNEGSLLSSSVNTEMLYTKKENVVFKK